MRPRMYTHAQALHRLLKEPTGVAFCGNCDTLARVGRAFSTACGVLKWGHRSDRERHR
jgi:hypothetical protein